MSLGPLTLEESTKLQALVQAAKTIFDLGVTPVRVWLFVARCDEHGEIRDEQVMDASQMPSSVGTVRCALCSVLPWKSASKPIMRASLIRG